MSETTTLQPVPAQTAAPDDAVAHALRAARQAQPAWAATPVRRRLAVIRRLRHRLADEAETLAAALTDANPMRRSVAETLAAEVLPLLDACRFLERRAAKLLAVRHEGVRGRPLWLWGCRASVQRVPHGVVLVIGPSNYPLMLPGVQALQALVAGNAAVIKPGRDGRPAAQALRRLLVDAGLDGRLVPVLGEAADEAAQALDAGVDLVVLTGSAATGRAVMERLADTLTPSVMELSGCDAMFVLPGADLDMAARAIAFGLRLNGSATCIAPRRVFVSREDCAALEQRVVAAAEDVGPVRVDERAWERAEALVEEAETAGARRLCGGRADRDGTHPLVLSDVPPSSDLLRSDVFAPVVSIVAVSDMDEALRLDAACPYALGASVFGEARDARALAARLRAGSVCINDVIAPTADPRLPFGGTGRSGFGVTRGAEGLLVMTRPRAVSERRGVFRPHYDAPGEGDRRMFSAAATALHARGLSRRARGWLEMIKAIRQRGVR